jgi:hypothetical protein
VTADEPPPSDRNQPIILALNTPLAPALFLLGFAITIQRYNRALRPVASAMNERFGVMNAGLAETIGGAELADRG